jgi:hypothetical protein
MQVYITKYALTQGIYKAKVEDCGGGMVKTPGSFTEGGGQCFHGEGRDWHRTREEAVKRANEMRDKRIKSLAKSMKKLERMEF